MKIQSILTITLIGIFFSLLFIGCVYIVNPKTRLDNLLLIVYLVLCMFAYVRIFSYIEKKVGKDIEEIERKARIRGAEMYHNQLQSKEYFIKVVNDRTLPLIDAKGQKYGTIYISKYLADELDSFVRDEKG